MTLEASILQEDSLHLAAGHYELDVHLPWYRSLPLSCVEQVEVSIDGESFAPADLRIRHNDTALTIEQLAELIDDEWFVQDPLVVVVPAASPSSAGDTANVEVSLAVRVPYIIIGPDTALVQRARVSREVTIS